MDQNKRPDVSFVWNLLDVVLRDVFRHNELGQVILPFVVLRRIDCCLKPVNEIVREAYKKFKDKLTPEKLVPVLRQSTAVNGKPLPFYNTSNFSMESLLDDPANIDINFKSYLNGFNAEVTDILDNFHFDSTLSRVVKYGLLYNLVQEICALKTITPEESDDIAMGYVFEEIIRIACEENNEDAGQHFTPRDAIRLMSALLFEPVKDDLNRSSIIRSIYDPTCGTGGMVNIGKKYILEEICTDGNHPTIKTYGQELNDQSFAIAKSESLITGNDAANIQLGNTLTNDQFPTEKFNFIMANPPYGTTWKKDQAYITNESMNPDGRFYAGLPRTSDGQFLFMQHMISKMSEKGSRVGIVTSGSPLFTGGAGSGESNIRKWIIDNDWLECIVALPTDLFYNAGIGTYIWILTNNKEERRKGKVQLINAVSFCTPSKKSLGNKRNDIREEDIRKILDIYNASEENGEFSRVFNNQKFGFLELTVEQPKRKANGELDLKKGNKQPDSSLRSTERVTLDKDVKEYFETEVLPHIDPESWLDLAKTRIGYEINFQQYFYEYKKLEKSSSIAERIIARQQEIMSMVSSIFND
jgi:type I restriction enzyme M protein